MSVFDYDLVGFQTAEHQQAFEEYVLNEADGATSSDSHLAAFGRTHAYIVHTDEDGLETIERHVLPRARPISGSRVRSSGPASRAVSASLSG